MEPSLVTATAGLKPRLGRQNGGLWCQAAFYKLAMEQHSLVPGLLPKYGLLVLVLLLYSHHGGLVINVFFILLVSKLAKTVIHFMGGK